ncbi:MAG TPA: efflux RND transporter periplasmic adaptor subunit [Bryobacteraceae bacterium]|nr:efflux RND transporter periplasmic adaptor subunit [Bryobacteraceae bacterium]
MAMLDAKMEPELKSLRIDRSKKSAPAPSRWAARWIIAGVLLFVLLGVGRYVYARLTAPVEVHVYRVRAASASEPAAGAVILNATGYIVAAHKIELASKVVGKVAWIGVEKGDHVHQGQVLVRLEDDEYRAQVMQARGNLENLQAKLAEMLNGSRPEEIERARADVEQSRADLENARISLERARQMYKDGVIARQAFDDAQARYDAALAKTNSLQRTYDLVKLGPRREQIDALRGQIEQAKGQLAYAETFLANTVIRAPVSGAILERNVEKGEFVTNGFVGDRGAKGYVVSMADLNDLKVELDINQNDFAKLGPRQPAVVTTDAFPDRKYDGVIDEISPEANRQKATIQVKVKILKPDEYLRPEMNASVAFVAREGAATRATAPPALFVPSAAVRDNSVFIVAQDRAVRRSIKTGSVTAQGVQVQDGLIGGEDVIIDPPADLKDGARVKIAAISPGGSGL